MDRRHTVLLERIDRHIQEMAHHTQEMDRRHTELLSDLLRRAS
jgi:hypothetical protein